MSCRQDFSGDRVSVVDKTNVGDWLPKSGSGDFKQNKIFFWLWFNLHYLSARAQGRSGSLYISVSKIYFQDRENGVAE